MVSKCVHKGCGKTFTDENEPCTYHPGRQSFTKDRKVCGLPEFHFLRPHRIQTTDLSDSGTGWKCCKPRVLTFDEFLSIPPCTTGKHSTVDDTPAPEPKPKTVEDIPPPPAPKPISSGAARRAVAQPTLAQSQSTPPPAPPESDSDEPSATLPPNTTCKRRGCNVDSSSCTTSREKEECVYHPGQALFHEGSKGWTCCKRRVLEFDEFMKIAGCKIRPRHCFTGKKRRKGGADGETAELETLSTVRSDYYQTSTTVHASFFLKKIDKAVSKVEFPESGSEVYMDLKTTDGKQYQATVPLYGQIDAGKSTFRVLGTKLEVTLAKADGAGWPVLRADEQPTGEIIQTGRAGRASDRSSQTK